jgi:hypothetical protein
MFAPSTSNQITYEYYCVLMSHSWSRHTVYAASWQNGNYQYSTYHLLTVR